MTLKYKGGEGGSVARDTTHPPARTLRQTRRSAYFQQDATRTLLPPCLALNHHFCLLYSSSTTPLSGSITSDLITMNGLQLRDEAVRDRIRAAQEFLDPGMREQQGCCA